MYLCAGVKYDQHVSLCRGEAWPVCVTAGVMSGQCVPPCRGDVWSACVAYLHCGAAHSRPGSSAPPRRAAGSTEVSGEQVVFVLFSNVYNDNQAFLSPATSFLLPF